MKEYDDVNCIACGDRGCEKCKTIMELQEIYAATKTPEDVIYTRIMTRADCQTVLEIAETLDNSRPAIHIMDVDEKIAFLKELARPIYPFDKVESDYT